MNMTIVPANGRDYTSKAKLLADFKAGKDFIVQDISSPYDGKHVNISDLRSAGITSVNARYKKLRNVAVLTITADGAKAA